MPKFLVGFENWEFASGQRTSKHCVMFKEFDCGGKMFANVASSTLANELGQTNLCKDHVA